jgi:urease accessory protein UreE
VTAGRLAFHLGNLHLPAQVTHDAILTPDDGPARAAAEQFGLPWAATVQRFYPEPVTLDQLMK